MRLLSILRHAKSSWKGDPAADHDRPLAPRGERDIPRVAQRLARFGPLPELVLCSTARRARDTAVAVCRAAGCAAEIRLQGGLYLATADTWRSALAELPESLGHALLVGHNPGLEELVLTLTGTGLELPTAALARLELKGDSWAAGADGGGRLLSSWRPREPE